MTVTLRRVLACAVLLLLLGGAQASAAIALVQTAGADVASGAGPFTLAFTNPTAAAGFISVEVRVGGTSTATITDDKSGGSNTYNADASLFHSGLGTGYIFSASNAGSAQTLTITLSAAATVRWIIREFSGISTTSPLDKTSTLYTAAGASTVNSGNTATTSQAVELLIGVCASNGADTFAAGTSVAYTDFTTQPSAANTGRLAAEDFVTSSTGAYQADFTSVATAVDHVTLIATYKAAGAATSTAKGLLLLGIGGALR